MSFLLLGVFGLGAKVVKNKSGKNSVKLDHCVGEASREASLSFVRS